jgi:hypothetical protein
MDILKPRVAENDLASEQDSPPHRNPIRIEAITHRVIPEPGRDDEDGKQRPGQKTLQGIVRHQLRVRPFNREDPLFVGSADAHGLGGTPSDWNKVLSSASVEAPLYRLGIPARKLTDRMNT